MNFVDTTVLVFACLQKHPHHAACLSLLNSADSITDTHCLAEAFATLNVAYKIRNSVAAELIMGRPMEIAQPVTAQDYRECIGNVSQFGIMGGGIYDAIHAAVARRHGVEVLFTHNVSNFRYCAPDLNVREP